MDKKSREVQDYWVFRFSSNFLSEDELKQEAYVVYLESKKSFDENAGTQFHTYYKHCLKNHFVNLYNKNKREQETIELIIDEPVQEDGEGEEITRGDLIPSSSWTPEEHLEWEELLKEVMNKLPLMCRELLRVELERPLEVLQYSKRHVMTITGLARYFSLRLKEIKKMNRRIDKVIKGVINDRRS